MPNIKMKDTTAHSTYGSMKQGEVYAVSDEDAAHLVEIGLASKTTAQTSAARAAELAEGDEPSLIEEQVEDAGTKPGDQATTRTPQPLNQPPQAITRDVAPERGRR